MRVGAGVCQDRAAAGVIPPTKFSIKRGQVGHQPTGRKTKRMHMVARKGEGERENEFSPPIPSEQPPTRERTIVINHVNLNKLNRQVEVNLTIGVYNLNLENFRATCSNTENARIVANK